MSVEAITWALSVQMERSSAKFVLVAMANCAGPDMRCWPSIPYLVDATCQDRKTVIENIRRLVDMRLIADTGYKKGRTGQIPIYCLNSSENGTVKESQNRNGYESGTVPKTDGNSTVFSSKQSQKRDTEPSRNHKEPSIESLSDEIAKQKNKKLRQKRESETQKAFIERCKAEGVKTVPADDPIFGYAEKVGLSEQMLALAWAAFKSQYLASMKRQKDWRAYFRNAVRGNWFKLWFISPEKDAVAQLTTAGQQALREQEARAMEMAA